MSEIKGLKFHKIYQNIFRKYTYKLSILILFACVEILCMLLTNYSCYLA